VNSVAMASLKPVSRTTLSEQVVVQLASGTRALEAGRETAFRSRALPGFSCWKVHPSRSIEVAGLHWNDRMRAGGGSYAAERSSNTCRDPGLQKVY